MVGIKYFWPPFLSTKVGFSVMTVNGCGESCASKIHNLSPVDVLRYHDHFDSLSQLAKKQWMLDYFIMTSSGEGEQREIPFLICGKAVCLQLWIATLGISQSYYYSVRTLFLRGHMRVIYARSVAHMLPV